MKFRKYTKELLEPIVANSTSMRQVLFSLGLSQSGGNNSHIKMVIERLGIDKSHFLGKRACLGNPIGKSHPDEYLIRYDKSHTVNTDIIKKRMFRDGVKEKKCEICKRKKWNGKEIPLEIHHKDGDRWNNVLNNLEIICPNCHAQTNNNSGKNIKKVEKIEKKYYCPNCGEEKLEKSPQCVKCTNISRRKVLNRPDRNILLEEIKTNGYVKTGKKYGVSDNAIRKWLR
jgi:hypothetical protein